MKEKVYIDSNIFVYAAINNEKEGEKAREILKKVKEGTWEGTSSLLTIDEVLWIIQKNVGKEMAHEIICTILIYPNMHFVDITKSLISEAIYIYKQKNLDPRDAIHLATMNFKNTSIIATNDADFDHIDGKKRIKLN